MTTAGRLTSMSACEPQHRWFRGRVRHLGQTDAFGASLQEAAKKPLAFGANLIEEPVATVSGIPKGVYHIFSYSYTALTSKRDPRQDEVYGSALLLSSYKPQYASQLGVDVYSSNAVLQKELNRVGWAGASDEEAANFYQHMAETLRGYHEKVSPIKKITVEAGLVLAKAGNGTVLLPFPLDHGVWTERAERVIGGLTARYDQATGTKNRDELWVTGTLSPLAKKELQARRIGLAEKTSISASSSWIDPAAAQAI